FGLKLADAYSFEDKETIAADVLLEVIRTAEPSFKIVSRCIFFLDFSKRRDESEDLIQRFKTKFAGESDFVTVWARHALRSEQKSAVNEIISLPVVARLRSSLAALLYLSGGRLEQAAGLAQPILGEISEREVSTKDLDELAVMFREIGRWEEFER